MSDRGQVLATAVGVYLVVKEILNGLIGGGINLIYLIFAVAAAVCLWKGVKWSNLVVAVVLMALFCTHFVTNIQNLGFNVYLLYLIEGVIDAGAAVLLAFYPDVRRHCKSNNI